MILQILFTKIAKTPAKAAATLPYMVPHSELGAYEAVEYESVRSIFQEVSTTILNSYKSQIPNPILNAQKNWQTWPRK